MMKNSYQIHLDYSPIAEAGGMIAKDYELRAEFEILYLEKKIPWDWKKEFQKLLKKE